MNGRAPAIAEDMSVPRSNISHHLSYYKEGENRMKDYTARIAPQQTAKSSDTWQLLLTKSSGNRSNSHYGHYKSFVRKKNLCYAIFRSWNAMKHKLHDVDEFRLTFAPTFIVIHSAFGNWKQMLSQQGNACHMSVRIQEKK